MDSSVITSDSLIYFTPVAAYVVYKVLYGVQSRLSLSSQHKVMRERAQSKRATRDGKTHETLSLSASSTLQFFDEDGISLSERIANGTISSTDSVIICSKRSYSIGRKLCAITEECYDDAYRQAQEIEARRGPDGKITLRDDETLFGIPISIKDGFQQGGYDCSMGTAVRCFKPYAEDGLLVKALKSAGGIPFVRSNIPQLLMMPESENIIWGVCQNPWDTTRTSGGSSGGEASLIAARISVCGLGSDIGGSIRIPAHYTGIVGFKPTPQRMSLRGQATPRKDNRNGQIVIRPTSGPMARSVRDCDQMMKVLLSPTVLAGDPTVPNLPWNSPFSSAEVKRPFKIAYFLTDGYFEPVPACKRAVQMAVDVLRSQGHEVVPMTLPYNTSKMIETYFALMSADGNWYYYLKALEGEDLYDSYKLLQFYTEIPNAFRPLISWLLSLSGEHRKARLVAITASGGLDVRTYWEWIADHRELCNAYTALFEQEGYDAVIYPGLGITAPPHGMAADLIPALSYTFLANLLHWPAGTVPVTTVQKSEEVYPLNDLPATQRDSLARLVAKSIIGSQGLPVGVQVMTPMWKDERCIEIMREIERGVNFQAKPANVR